jgi:plasmid maintenance system antidote protein VapI
MAGRERRFGNELKKFLNLLDGSTDREPMQRYGRRLLADRITEFRFSTRTAAALIGVEEWWIEAVLAGKEKIDYRTARKLQAAFGDPADDWLTKGT